MSVTQRILIVARDGQSTYRFAVGLSGIHYTHDCESLDELARRIGLRRLDGFDWAVGDAGHRCSLMEAPDTSWTSPSETMATCSLRWLDFPNAARQLPGGDDRRYLLLAVQYLAAGGVIDNNVVAAELDVPLVGKIAETLNSDINTSEGET